ncbi:hypothetical protein DV735_g3948, partial [Chaetothyriales sp. CBS 134920]
MSADTLFDRESYLLRETSSPQLEVAIPNFETVETPSPDVKTREPSPVPVSDEDTEGGGARKRRGEMTGAVLLRQLDPTRIGLSHQAGEYAVESESEAEEDGSAFRRRGAAHTPATHVPPQPGHHIQNNSTPAQTAQPLCRGDGPNDLITMSNGTPAAAVPKPRTLGSPADIKISLKYYDTIPPQLPSPFVHRDDEESLSPTLVKYFTPPSHADPKNILSPMNSQQIGSPNYKQTLPPLMTTLQDSVVTPAPTPLSPTRVRASPASLSQYSQTPSTTHPSPYSARSPLSMSESVLWRSSAAGSAGTPLTSTPAPSLVHTTPAPTLPSIAMIDQSEQEDSNQQSISPTNVDIEATCLTNDETSTIISFKCTFKGCNATPFPTQYLLNSHTKVHSEDRPHFCPVANCRRGPGGQGFKRKNEMIRHITTTKTEKTRFSQMSLPSGPKAALEAADGGLDRERASTGCQTWGHVSNNKETKRSFARQAISQKLSVFKLSLACDLADRKHVYAAAAVWSTQMMAKLHLLWKPRKLQTRIIINRDRDQR